MKSFKSIFVGTISQDVTLTKEEFNEDSKASYTFSYILERNFLGKPKCKCNRKSVKYDRFDNPTGPGVSWKECKFTDLEVYQKYIWPWLKGDYTALSKYFTDRGLDVPATVAHDEIKYAVKNNIKE